MTDRPFSHPSSEEIKTPWSVHGLDDEGVQPLVQEESVGEEHLYTEGDMEATRMIEIAPDAIEKALRETLLRYPDKKDKSNVRKRLQNFLGALDIVLEMAETADKKKGAVSLRHLTEISLATLNEILVNVLGKDLSKSAQTKFADRRFARDRTNEEKFSITDQLTAIEHTDERLKILFDFFQKNHLDTDPAVLDFFKDWGSFTYRETSELLPFETSDSFVATERGTYDLEVFPSWMDTLLNVFPGDVAAMTTAMVLTELMVHKEIYVGRALASFIDMSRVLNTRYNAFLEVEVLDALEPLGVTQGKESEEKLRLYKQSSVSRLLRDTMIISIRGEYDVCQQIGIQLPENEILNEFLSGNEKVGAAVFYLLYKQISEKMRMPEDIHLIDPEDVSRAYSIPESLLRKVITKLTRAKSSSSDRFTADVAVVFASSEQKGTVLPGQISYTGDDPRGATPRVYTVFCDRNGRAEGAGVHIVHPQLDGALAQELFSEEGRLHQSMKGVSDTIAEVKMNETLSDGFLPWKRTAISQVESVDSRETLEKRRRLCQEQTYDVRGEVRISEDWKKAQEKRLRAVNEKIQEYVFLLTGIEIGLGKDTEFLLNFDNLKSQVFGHIESVLGMDGNGYDWLITGTDARFAPTIDPALSPTEAKRVYSLPTEQWKSDPKRGERLLHLKSLNLKDRNLPIQTLIALGYIVDQTYTEKLLSTLSSGVTDRDRAKFVTAGKRGLLSKLSGPVDSFYTALLEYYDNHFAISVTKDKTGRNRTKLRVKRELKDKLDAINIPFEGTSKTLFEVIYERTLEDIEAFVKSTDFESRLKELRGERKQAEEKVAERNRQVLQGGKSLTISRTPDIIPLSSCESRLRRDRVHPKNSREIEFLPRFSDEQYFEPIMYRSPPARG